MKSLILSLAAVAALTASPVFAGAGHGPSHGGVAREVKSITYELVARPDSLTLYLSDHGKSIPTRGARAEAVIYAGNDKTTVALAPAGDNRMTARGSFKLGVGVRVMLTVTLAGKQPAKVSFNLK